MKKEDAIMTHITNYRYSQFLTGKMPGEVIRVGPVLMLPGSCAGNFS
jgi:hypothetical protein